MSSLDNLKNRIDYNGGKIAEERMNLSKLRSLKKALLYSYQAQTAELTDGRQFRCLINHDKLKEDYDDKIISIPYKDICLNAEGRKGKTSIIERYINRTFKGNYIATIGMDIRLKRLEINNNDVNISITDTAGQERFRSITKMFYKGADGILVGFDLTEPNTLEQVNYWIDQIEMNRSKEYPISLVLFGNKYDDKENIKVQEEDIKKMEEKYNLKYFPTSAKDGTNVQNVFEYLTKITLKTRGYLPKIGLSEETNIDDINIVEKENQKLDIKKTPRKKKKKTC